ncbi:MAG: flagellar FliJ family protein [Alphaproteobacteria bacterium]|nr:flagellar FliJ family protein [Alphaproteobacteria bacterium]MCD8570223.1 flagellar FliJ family protein [Alphaproteobacteria bacterium]
MADLSALIRVRKHTVEQKQKALADLYRQAEELLSQKKKLLDQLAIERQKVDEMGVEALGYFGRYSEVVRERSEEIDDSMKMLESRIDVAREDMRLAFAELKKVEITQERRDDEEEKEREKKDAATLDEIAIEGYRRQMVEEGEE